MEAVTDAITATDMAALAAHPTYLACAAVAAQMQDVNIVSSCPGP
jgi:hypothetical protein